MREKLCMRVLCSVHFCIWFVIIKRRIVYCVACPTHMLQLKLKLKLKIHFRSNLSAPHKHQLATKLGRWVPLGLPQLHLQRADSWERVKCSAGTAPLHHCTSPTPSFPLYHPLPPPAFIPRSLSVPQGGILTQFVACVPPFKRKTSVFRCFPFFVNFALVFFFDLLSLTVCPDVLADFGKRGTHLCPR